jgi:hypothetical protein
MSGHRKREGKELRSKRRNDVWRERIAIAPTVEQQFSVAADWIRSSAHNFPDPAERERVLTDAAEYLAERADQLDRKMIAAATPRGRAGVYSGR